jgi:hypothetical protein
MHTQNCQVKTARQAAQHSEKVKMRKERVNFYLAFLYLLVGIQSTIASGYLIIKYFLISKNNWYILDLSIGFLMLIALSVTLVILLKKTTEMLKIWFYRVFIGLGVVGTTSLLMLRFFVAIYQFPPKLMIATLIIDGTIIKMVLDKKIKPSLRPSSDANAA